MSPLFPPRSVSQGTSEPISLMGLPSARDADDAWRLTIRPTAPISSVHLARDGSQGAEAIASPSWRPCSRIESARRHRGSEDGPGESSPDQARPFG
jgi:hypothetical protein